MHEHFNQAFFDERYRSKPMLWSGNPNPQLVAEIVDLPPGTALDVGCGEGADAIWLAERGWHVTAADFSQVALDRAAARAATLDPEIANRIEWLHTDFTTWVPDPASYDLVSAHFFHLPKALRDVVFRALAAAVSPGGTLLIVGHHPSDMQAPIMRPSMADSYFTAEELVTELLVPNEWDVVVADTRERATTNAEDQHVTIHDTVLRATRGEL